MVKQTFKIYPGSDGAKFCQNQICPPPAKLNGPPLTVCIRVLKIIASITPKKSRISLCKNHIQICPPPVKLNGPPLTACMHALYFYAGLPRQVYIHVRSCIHVHSTDVQTETSLENVCILFINIVKMYVTAGKNYVYFSSKCSKAAYRCWIWDIFYTGFRFVTILSPTLWSVKLA